MISLTRFNLCFTPSLRMFILTLFAMMMFIHLGLWQLERAHEKERLLMSANQQMSQPLVDWQPTNLLPKPYQLLQIQGHYLSTTLLLDNQHHQHQFGYDVVTPLMLSNGSVVLIDRGWVKADQVHHQLPKISIPKGELNILGSAYYPSSKQFILGQSFDAQDANSVIIELLDVKIISQILHKSVYPFIIRQDQSQANGYIREWSIVSMPPTRHYGYAVQWFAIASMIFILFMALNLKKKI